jgi:hypothetical protein
VRLTCADSYDLLELGCHDGVPIYDVIENGTLPAREHILTALT